MFVTQVHAKPISAEEKFGYLLEMVSPKVRESIANLKPGEMGYKVAWERLQSEYGQTKLVINAHVNEIVNLPVVRGTNYTKIQEFYEKVSKNFDSLLTLREAEMLCVFVMTTLNKLPHVKPDLVRTELGELGHGSFYRWTEEVAEKTQHRRTTWRFLQTTFGFVQTAKGS